jgi:hypothetical protein
MPTGLEISRAFIESTILPLLKRELPDDYDRLAVAIVGTGSDVIGLDDTISRDHHWGPRANVMVLDEDAERLGPRVREILRTKVPEHHEEFEVHIDNLTGVCSTSVSKFFEYFLGTAALPQSELDWLSYCEVDLFHVTAGEIVYDGPGELTRRRGAISYYPDNVWKKRIADWCMYVAGRDAPYNLHRVSKRGDEITSTTYLGLCVKRMMELCFALNRSYAPYTKWLNRSFRTLPKYVDDIAPLLDSLFRDNTVENNAAEDGNKQWRGRVLTLVDISKHIARALADLGLTDPPVDRKFDEGLTDLTLYDSAAQIYAQIPKELFEPSFNQIELWERMARAVLFDSNDYFKTYKEND